MKDSDFKVKSIHALKQKLGMKCHEEDKYIISGTVHVNRKPINWEYYRDTNIIQFYPEGFFSSSNSEESK